MKQKLSLLEVCKLPDVQLHSKTAFFKSIVAREAPEITQMKDHIASLTYTVKVIGVQGEEVGITSKRVPMTFRRSEENRLKNNFIPVDNYLPHKTFYSHALVPIHIQKDPPTIEKEPLFAISANGAVRVGSPQRKTASFKTRTKSMANIRNTHKRHLPANIDEIGKVSAKRQPQGGLKKKSYSGLLKECNKMVNEKMNPLLHEENVLFKKIQKIKAAYPDRNRPQIKIEKYESRKRDTFSSMSSKTRHYQYQL